jgi:hypothetical protein
VEGQRPEVLGREVERLAGQRVPPDP